MSGSVSGLNGLENRGSRRAKENHIDCAPIQTACAGHRKKEGRQSSKQGSHSQRGTIVHSTRGGVAADGRCMTSCREGPG